MLHTIFLILKVIGIILLSVLLLILLLLLVPFSYNFRADSDGKIYNVQFKVAWIMNLIHFRLFKNNDDLNYKLKIFGITVYKSKQVDEPKEESVKKEKEKTEKKGIKSFFEKIKNICKNIKEIYLTLVAESTKRAFVYTKNILIHLLKHIRPSKIKGNICFGFEEPHLTGQTLGYIAIGYNMLKINPKEIVIEPDFEQKIFKGQLKVKGRFILLVILIDVLKFYLNEDIRTILNKFSKEA